MYLYWQNITIQSQYYKFKIMFSFGTRYLCGRANYSYYTPFTLNEQAHLICYRTYSEPSIFSGDQLNCLACDHITFRQTVSKNIANFNNKKATKY